MSKPILYFDTNVYARYVERGEESDFLFLLGELDVEVPFSDIVLQEMDPIPDQAGRNAEWQLLAQAATHPGEWLSLLTTKEVLREIARCRPGWLADTVQANLLLQQALRGRMELWESLRRGIVAPAEARAQADMGFKSGKLLKKEQEKTRNIVKKSNRFFALDRSGKPLKTYPLEKLDDFWREDCTLTWHAAIRQRKPAYRDFQICLGSSLKPHAFESNVSGADFWFHDVDSNALPLNRIRGMVYYLQMNRPLQQGNGGDCRHSPYANLVDHFFTCDKNFFEILTQVKDEVGFRASIHWIDKDAPSLSAQIRKMASV